jgi:hypothetical protein
MKFWSTTLSQTSLAANASVEIIINDKAEMINAVLFITRLFYAIILNVFHYKRLWPSPKAIDWSKLTFPICTVKKHTFLRSIPLILQKSA